MGDDLGRNSLLLTVAHNCHGKIKSFAVKKNHSRQKQIFRVEGLVRKSNMFCPNCGNETGGGGGRES